jgi:hypothetical protein
MGFLSPILLASFAVLAVPLWLHLRRKRRQTPVEFPSLRYLKMAAARMKRQARVEDVGLLLLRLLLVALLAAAFSRPVLRSSGGWLGAGRSVESVVVIDATASMGWRGESGTRIEASKRLAREWIAGLDRSDSVALWVLTDRLEKRVPVPIADRGFLFQQLDAIVASDGSSGLAPVFHAAREWAESRGVGRKELVVITDNHAAAWDWPAEGFFRGSWDRGGVNLAVLSPDSARASNVAVESVEWDGRTVREGALLTGVARIANHGDTPTSDLLECRIGGEMMFRKPVEIPAGGSLDVPLSLPVPAIDGPVLTGELALAGDALACDDRWYFALPVRRPFHALVVERGSGLGGGMRPSYFLTRALAAGGAGKATVIESDGWARQSTDDIDSLWFTGGAVENEAAWAKARAFAEAGGTVVVTGDSQPEPLPAGWPVTAGGETSLPTGRMATRLLAPAHPLFDGVWSEQTPFPPLPQRIARSCTPAEGAKLLATLAGGFPLLVEAPVGKGRVLWLNASADRNWGDLPLSPAYVALVQQMARARELALQSVTTCWVGEAWPDLSNFAEAASWPTAEDGGPSARALRGGLFDAVSTDGEILWRAAVNVRRAESDLRAVESAKLQAMLPGKLVSGQQGIREWREEIRREVPLWPWLLAVAALVFLTEGWMGARAAGRREVAAGGATPKWLGRRAGA